MSEIVVSREAIVVERQRRAKEKCDELQAKFSPYNENSLWLFCQHMSPEFYTDDKVLLKELTEVFRKITIGELKKVLISFFPRGGKSRTTTNWIIWWLGYDQTGSFMRNCYNDNLAMDLSKAALDGIDSPQYKEVFPDVKIDPSARSKMSWQLDGTTIATYFGAGINGTITGKGCNRAAIFDDPIKNPEEAMSESYLEKVDTFIDYAITSRIQDENCAIVIISTRWSSQDPIGLREKDPDWHTFIFPVLDKDGNATCEAMFPAERAIKIRDGWKAKGRVWMFDALYMCEPTDASFSKISLDNLKRFSMKDIEGKEPDEKVGWCDYANKGSDYLSAPFCYRFGRRRYIVGVVFSNKDSRELEKPLLKKIIMHRPEDGMVIESNQGGSEFAEKFSEKYSKILEAIGIEIDTKYATINKEIRILLRLGEIKNDCYFLVDEEQDQEYKEFIGNLTKYGKFKSGKDDAPDSMAGLLSFFSGASDVEADYYDGENKNLDNYSDDNEDEYDSDDESDIEIY